MKIPTSVQQAIVVFVGIIALYFSLTYVHNREVQDRKDVREEMRRIIRNEALSRAEGESLADKVSGGRQAMDKARKK